MEARWIKLAIFLSIFPSLGATYRTKNFVVHAPTELVAKAVGTKAEHDRDRLAVEWLGRKLP